MGLWVDPTRTIRYIPEADEGKPAEEQSAFYLRALTAREFASFRDRAVAPGADGLSRTQVYAFDIELLRLALTGWEGPGAPAFPKDATPSTVEEALSLIHPDLRDELSRAAYDMNKVTEDERKN